MEGEGDCGDCHLETLVLPACCQASPSLVITPVSGTRCSQARAFPGYYPCMRPACSQALYLLCTCGAYYGFGSVRTVSKV